MTAESLNSHDEQKAKHAYDIEENELHKETSKEEHAQHSNHEAKHEYTKYEEKGARREEDVKMSELTEEINTDLRSEE